MSNTLTRDELVAAYRQLNSSKKTRLVHTIGSKGFGYEIHKITASVLFCLDKDIVFQLNASLSNLSAWAWTNMFSSFCPIEQNIYWKLDNFRHRKMAQKIFQKIPFTRKKPTQSINNYFVLHARGKQRNRKFSFPTLSINGNMVEALRIILPMIYCPNKSAQQMITDRVSSFKQFKPYITIQIRRGEKVVEVQNTPTIKYISALKKHDKAIKNILVLTDDYRSFEDIKAQLHADSSDWNVATTCFPYQRGHYEKLADNTNKAGIPSREQMMLAVLTDIELMVEAEIAIITGYSSFGALASRLRSCKNLNTVHVYPENTHFVANGRQMFAM